jgi:spermidine synthase
VGHEECFTIIHRTLASVFRHTTSCQAHVPAFQTLWGFNLASDAPLPRLTPAQVDRLAGQRITHPLRFYDGETHSNMFALPKFLRHGLQAQGRTSRDADPVFSF